MKQIPAKRLIAELFGQDALFQVVSGVIKHDGKMMMMENGKPAGAMDHDMTMSDGTKVMTNGMVKMKDGTEKPMKDGQMMTMDGKIMEGGKAMDMMKK